MPVSNVITVYDAYSISKDQRGIYSIAKDKLIKTKIQTKIFATKGLNSLDLEVESFYSNVYLIGLIDSEKYRNIIIDLAKNTNGVKKIYTYLKVKQKNYPCNNLAILASLKKELFTDKKINATRIRVSIVGCDVVFSGIINSKKQEEYAIWYAKHIQSVKNVYSFLRLLN
ncbi:putative lipoprotein (BON/OsmY domain) [Campylobacter pinnipediorum subsp. caledonicus]|uniref:Putative lipoprotein (BON/OsmY domain) n=1 Tax=Campylobacter pinnipediorum subsp. caledonicus TaxID=1874362 RepID=A0A1S6U7C3_9BACT|nr:BON domain-containing protein [Campylobacter pinnipediorum]AQW86047.1 putative lipoprotein (BON/OsmY domain) [Campylobacter pinnipediorum subsp. caledonicus]AQW87654.1 putative lipoprotein (BON/OsmY domain) [Campylobacter pinnipediorum subsp. caledonicus]OPA72215.1 transporter [Campylobacter pinnipediorum subsp. caledonicus]